jgi:hypothetical protein
MSLTLLDVALVIMVFAGIVQLIRCLRGEKK